MKRYCRRFLPPFFCLALAAIWSIPDLRAQENAPPEASAFIIIVHVDNPTTKMEQKDLSKMFLGKMKGWKSWDDSPPVKPVDLPPQSETRIAFTSAVHEKNMSSISSYWQRMIFSGRGAPPDLVASEPEVIAFVADNPGSIGYVSPSTQIEPSETDPAKMNAQDKLKAKVKRLNVDY